eukprot:gnl/Hemi2/16015_TR5299_c0_g1_i1.p1 gnl/Hemi2/16015_TR5299_c0_g1~~gnl/Hemi2/16015_TR5299_c0_g1_i1.p1  ORF type:complete len:144 (+),score=23.84 gnl/Hemi2/16015_TR5299_c0_g1_i1:32-433(+)
MSCFASNSASCGVCVPKVFPKYLPLFFRHISERTGKDLTWLDAAARAEWEAFQATGKPRAPRKQRSMARSEAPAEDDDDAASVRPSKRARTDAPAVLQKKLEIERELGSVLPDDKAVVVMNLISQLVDLVTHD